MIFQKVFSRKPSWIPSSFSREPVLRLFLPCLSFLGTTLPFPSHAQNWRHPERDTVIYRYPMRIEPEISGSFAELRATHFHGGMDFRTKQREGIKVYSAAPGYIVRATVERASYGNALYVWHPNGTLSIYGHLKKFSQPVKRRVKRLQRQSGQFEVSLDNLYIKTRKNRAIARSGNTGASGGPHLHFELLRDSLRLNPACWGLEIPDTVAPELLWFAFYSSSAAGYADTSLPRRHAEAQARLDALKEARSGNADILAEYMGSPLLDYRMQKALEQERDSLWHCVLIMDDTLPSRNMADLHLDLPQTGNPDWKGWYYKYGNLPDTLFINAASAFGLCALDRIQGMPFHYGLYRLSFLIDWDEPIGGKQPSGTPAAEQGRNPDMPYTAPDEASPIEIIESDGGFGAQASASEEDGIRNPMTQRGIQSETAYDTIASYQLDYLPVATCKAIGQHIDLPFYRATKNRLEKSYLESGQSLTPYRILQNRGIFQPRTGSQGSLIIIAEDLAGNQSRICIPFICR